LGLLKTLPDTLERTHKELTLHLALGVLLQVTKGFASAEVERAYARARELCQQIGDTPQTFPVLRGLWQFYLTRTETQTARELAEQMMEFAQRVTDSALLVEAHHTLGATLCTSSENSFSLVSIWSRLLLCMIPSSIEPWPFTPDMILLWDASCVWVMSAGT